MNLLEIEQKIKNGEMDVIYISDEIKKLEKDRFHYLVINGHLIREDKFYILCFIIFLTFSIFIFLIYKNKGKINVIMNNIFFKIKNILYFIKKKNMEITLIHVLLLIIITLLIILCFK